MEGILLVPMADNSLNNPLTKCSFGFSYIRCCFLTEQIKVVLVRLTHRQSLSIGLHIVQDNTFTTRLESGQIFPCYMSYSALSKAIPSVLSLSAPDPGLPKRVQHFSSNLLPFRISSKLRDIIHIDRDISYSMVLYHRDFKPYIL